MNLYILHYRGELTNNEASIITIHRSLKGARKEIYIILERYDRKEKIPEYFITKINTDTIDSDIIYNYENYND